MNNSGGYAPYMFGQSYGMASPQPNTNMPNNNYAGQSTRRDAFNVRDCMYWPASLGDTRNNAPRTNGGMNQGSYPMNQNYQSFNRGSPMPMTGGMGSADPYTFHAGEYANGEPQQIQPTQPVKAFIQPGEGNQRVQIPCHMGSGPGQVPPVQPMQPMGYKVQVPPLPPTQPVEFEVGQK